SASQLANDAVTVDTAYGELIALSPKDGALWLDRGNVRLAAKHFADAIDSFAKAEPLLATDPERRLSAMMNRGVALDGLGRTDDAIAQYEHTLAAAPPDYYLAQDLVAHIVDADRRRGRLAAAIARLEQRWPERTRGYIAWATLGDLYKESK